MLLITEQFRDDLVRYLLTRPCGEVINGVIGLRSLTEAPESPAAYEPQPDFSASLEPVP